MSGCTAKAWLQSWLLTACQTCCPGEQGVRMRQRLKLRVPNTQGRSVLVDSVQLLLLRYRNERVLNRSLRRLCRRQEFSQQRGSPVRCPAGFRAGVLAAKPGFEYSAARPGCREPGQKIVKTRKLAFGNPLRIFPMPCVQYPSRVTNSIFIATVSTVAFDTKWFALTHQ